MPKTTTSRLRATCALATDAELDTLRRRSMGLELGVVMDEIDRRAGRAPWPRGDESPKESPMKTTEIEGTRVDLVWRYTYVRELRLFANEVQVAVIWLKADEPKKTCLADLIGSNGQKIVAYTGSKLSVAKAKCSAAAVKMIAEDATLLARMRAYVDARTINGARLEPEWKRDKYGNRWLYVYGQRMGQLMPQLVGRGTITWRAAVARGHRMGESGFGVGNAKNECFAAVVELLRTIDARPVEATKGTETTH
ncbi:MAG: hypothetical protein ACHREM_01035 [Polyangiales bacterium]